MRNVLLHPEDYWNFLATHHIDYQKYSLKMLYLAHKVQEEYKAYHKKTGKPNRKKRERKTYKKFKKYMSAAQKKDARWIMNQRALKLDGTSALPYVIPFIKYGVEIPTSSMPWISAFS